MEKIFNTLQLNINEYIESALAGQTAYANVNPNIDTDQMYNFDVVFENFYNNYKHYWENGSVNYIHQNTAKTKQSHVHYVFKVLNNFLKQSETKTYIGIIDALICFMSMNNQGSRGNLIIKTDRNLIIKVSGSPQKIDNSCRNFCSCDFESIGINANEIKIRLWISWDGGCPPELYKHQEYCQATKLSEEEINNYCLQIKKLLKHTEPKIYLDYLLTCDDDFIKSFLSTATGPVMIEKSNEIVQLKTKLEEKAEKIELLTDEVNKWKAHAKKLEQNRLSMITFKDNEIAQLKKQMEELEKSNQQKLKQELEQAKQTISNIYETKIKKNEAKIRQITDDNNLSLKEHKDKIDRLTDKVNSELLENKKLKMKLSDINDLYENLQKKIVQNNL